MKNSILHERFFRTFAAMFEKLQKKWKVNGLQLTLILCTFAMGGSLTGYSGRKLMPLFGIGPNWLWIIVYIILITLIWPLFYQLSEKNWQEDGLGRRFKAGSHH